MNCFQIFGFIILQILIQNEIKMDEKRLNQFN